MKKRTFWMKKIERAWKRKTVVWLSGVRRVGKTVLCQSLPGIEYFDCESPSARRRMSDPEVFLRSLGNRRVVLDEVHRLMNPSELLKLAADHFPGCQILATGSSTLQATAKFRDTLTGRKAEVWLTPMISEDLREFRSGGLRERLSRGGLPPFFLGIDAGEGSYQAWLDSYWAKDILVLFRLQYQASFQRFFELLLGNSGGIFEASRYARPCEISRTTVAHYLASLEMTWVAHVIRPHSTHPATEITSAPKVYAFDTGFVYAFKGCNVDRPEDAGLLWEHYVLNEIMARGLGRAARYWRDKRGHEVDFVIARPGAPLIAIECKWSSDGFDSKGLRAFRRQYPEGENWCVCADETSHYLRKEGGLEVVFMGIEALARKLEGR